MLIQIRMQINTDQSHKTNSEGPRHCRICLTLYVCYHVVCHLAKSGCWYDIQSHGFTVSVKSTSIKDKHDIFTHLLYMNQITKQSVLFINITELGNFMARTTILINSY